MAKEVIVNDGGAPARILPFVSAATGSAGDPIVIDTAGKTAALTAAFKVAGFLLTDVDAVGDMASVVMGSGCILNVTCKADVTVGEILSAGTARLDGVANNATQGGLDDGVEIVGIALEAGDTATDLPIKVLVL
jgi:hypothetical protein